MNKTIKTNYDYKILTPIEVELENLKNALKAKKPKYAMEKARLGNRAIYGSFLEEHYVEVAYCSKCNEYLDKTWKYCANCGQKIDWRK